jgi:ABC-type multidrug transport system ATPase subunit
VTKKVVGDNITLNGLHRNSSNQRYNQTNRCSGTTILLASHLLDEVESMLSCIGFKKRGHLYSGTVDGMSANEGFFELQADDTKMIEVLRTHPAVESIKQEEGKVLFI